MSDSLFDGIDNTGTLIVTGVTFSHDSGHGGYSIHNETGGKAVVASSLITNTIGMGIGNDGTLTVTDSTISANTLGGFVNYGTAKLVASTISGNSAIYGGGIYNGGSMTMLDCTIAGNSAYQGGGIINVGGSLAIDSSTIADNQVSDLPPDPPFYSASGDGAGIRVVAGNFQIDDSIVASNVYHSSAGPISEDIVAFGGTFLTCSYNLVGTVFNIGSAGSVLVNGANDNQIGVTNPGLGTLANNGGPTQTIALLLGSPAINAGSNLLSAFSSTDQRGQPRISYGTVDIGAFEYQFLTSAELDHSFVAYWAQKESRRFSLLRTGKSLLPPGRKNDLPWYGIDMLQVTFAQPLVLTAADVVIASARGVDYGPVTITGSGMTYTIMFARPIDEADRLTITISIVGADTIINQLNVLPGDANGDGMVNSKDVTIIQNESKGKKDAIPAIFSEILGDGTVSTTDYRQAASSYQPSCPVSQARPTGVQKRFQDAISSPRTVRHARRNSHCNPSRLTLP